MSTTFKRLVEINAQKKENLKNNEKAIKIRIVEENKKYFVVNTSTNAKKKIVQLGTLCDIIRRRNVYIENISLLSNATSIINNYYITSQEWRTLSVWINSASEYKRKTLNSFSIKKVDDLNVVLAKEVLKGSLVLCDMTAYALIQNNLDVTLITDVNLAVSDRTGFDFQGLRIKNIIISNIDTTNREIGLLTKLNCMFLDCYWTEQILFYNFNTKNIKSFRSMFNTCKELKKVNVEDLDVSNAQDLSCMFFDCKKLENLKLDNWVLSNKYNIDCDYMFCGCEKLNAPQPKVITDLVNINITKKQLYSKY